MLAAHSSFRCAPGRRTELTGKGAGGFSWSERDDMQTGATRLRNAPHAPKAMHCDDDDDDDDVREVVVLKLFAHFRHGCRAESLNAAHPGGRRRALSHARTRTHRQLQGHTHKHTHNLVGFCTHCATDTAATTGRKFCRRRSIHPLANCPVRRPTNMSWSAAVPLSVCRRFVDGIFI